MFPRQEMPDELLRLMQVQRGAVSAQQVVAAGMSREALRRLSASWVRLGNGIYVDGEVTWEAFVWAAVLRGGEGASVGGGAACHLHGVVRRPPRRVTIWVPQRRAPLVHGDLEAVFRVGERSSRGEPSATRLEDSILDYADEASRLDLVEAVTRAIGERRTTAARLRHHMSGRSRQRQSRLLTRLTDQQAHGIHSVLEWEFNELVMLPHGLGGVMRQVRLSNVGRVDVYLEEFGLVIELDGRQFHDAERDARRDNEHALRHGVVTLRFTWTQVIHGACEVARVVARALRQRGWDGGLGSCPDCRLVGE